MWWGGGNCGGVGFLGVLAGADPTSRVCPVGEPGRA